MTATDDTLTWWAVVPVKHARDGKTRLAGVLDDDERMRLVRRLARATVEAVLATPHVAGAVLVTPDPVLARVDVLDEPVVPRGAGHDAPVTGLGAGLGAWAGLDRAVRAGQTRARTLAPRAGVLVALGDLPHLDPVELGTVLRRAARSSRGYVPDAAGTGTTLLTATPPHVVLPSFGPGSAGRHASNGHTLLEVPQISGLRRDVDVPADLAPTGSARGRGPI